MNKLLLIAILVSFAVGTPRADTAVPPLVNYQGLLTDENGAAVSDGMKKLEFNLYDAPLAGNRVWGPQVFDNVPIINGRFNVILGTTDNTGRSLTDAFAGEQRYLGFKVGNVGADLSTVAEISPRQQILSSPFAFQSLRANQALQSLHASQADHADTADVANQLQGYDLHADGTAIGIGTAHVGQVSNSTYRARSGRRNIARKAEPFARIRRCGLNSTIRTPRPMSVRRKG